MQPRLAENPVLVALCLRRGVAMELKGDQKMGPRDIPGPVWSNNCGPSATVDMTVDTIQTGDTEDHVAFWIDLVGVSTISK